MRRLPRRVAWTIYAVLVLVLAARAAWVASRTETGWETFALQWKEATLGWFVGEYVRVQDLEPVDQAEFWLAETNRILSDHPNDAALAIGAACVLDKAMSGFSSRYATRGRWGVDVDHDAIQQAEDKFEELCRKRCLALAAKATELEPSNVNWWRCRALIQFQESWEGLTPRNSDWQEATEECARHEPDNALYDYLMAWYLWQTSSERDYDVHPIRLTITDSERFGQGVDYLERGVRKSRFVVDDPELAALARFVALSRLPLLEHAEVFADRPSGMRAARIPQHVMNTRAYQANTIVKQGDPAVAVELLRGNWRIDEQVMLTTGSEGWNLLHLCTHGLAASTFHEFVQRNPGLISRDEEWRIGRAYEEASLTRQVFFAADQNIVKLRSGNTLSTASRVPAECIADARAISLFVLIAVLAMFFSRSTRAGQRDESFRLGAARHAIAWIAGFAIVFAVLGLAPAEIISHRVQGIVVLVLTAAFAMTCVAMLIWQARNSKFQFSLRTLLAFSFGVAVVCSLISWSGFGMAEIRGLTDSIHIPARGWQGIDASLLKAPLLIQAGRCAWVAIQWWAYSGLAMSGLVVLGIIALWHVWRSARLNGQAVFGNWFSHPRQHIVGTLLEVSKSATALAACCLLVYLVATPIVIDDAEAWFRDEIAHIRNPHVYDDLLRVEIAKIKADPVQMAAIRATVKERMSSTNE